MAGARTRAGLPFVGCHTVAGEWAGGRRAQCLQSRTAHVRAGESDAAGKTGHRSWRGHGPSRVAGGPARERGALPPAAGFLTRGDLWGRHPGTLHLREPGLPQHAGLHAGRDARQERASAHSSHPPGRPSVPQARLSSSPLHPAGQIHARRQRGALAQGWQQLPGGVLVPPHVPQWRTGGRGRQFRGHHRPQASRRGPARERSALPCHGGTLRRLDLGDRHAGAAYLQQSAGPGQSGL